MSTRIFRLWGFPVILLAGLLSVGCGKTAGDIPPTAPVSGVVLLDGKPVDGAMVVFAPVGGGRYGAYAITDSAGRFELKASEDVKGAVPGKYRVQVTKLVREGAGSQFLVQEDLEHALKAGGASRPGQEGQTKNVLPQKYANPETSGIEVTVPQGGLSNLEIKLTSQ